MEAWTQDYDVDGPLQLVSQKKKKKKKAIKSKTTNINDKLTTPRKQLIQKSIRKN